MAEEEKFEEIKLPSATNEKKSPLENEFLQDERTNFVEVVFVFDPTNREIRVIPTQHLYHLALKNFQELRWYDDGNNYVGFEAPALAANQIWTLPPVDATAANQPIVSNAAGALSFFGEELFTRNYGEIWVMGNAVATAIGVAGTFVQFIGFTNNGQSAVSTPDHTNNYITIGATGIYEIISSFHIESVGGGAADTVGVEIRKNGGTIILSNLHAHRKLAGGGGDIGSISVSGLASLTLDDTLEVWLANEDNATNLLLEDANLSVVRID